jgi:transketolase
VDSAEDVDAIAAAVKEAKADKKHPSLIIVRTHIGYASPKQDSASAHGEPLGAVAAAKTKEAIGWPSASAFYIPEAVKGHFAKKLPLCDEKMKNWEALLADYEIVHPEEASELKARSSGEATVNLTSSSRFSTTLPRPPAGSLGYIFRSSRLVACACRGSADRALQQEDSRTGLFSAEDRNGRKHPFRSQ